MAKYCWLIIPEFATQCTPHAVMMSTQVTSAAPLMSRVWTQRQSTTFKGDSMTPPWIRPYVRSRLGQGCAGGESHFTWSPPHYVSIARPPPARWFRKQEMLVSTDLDRAGVLRIVQQPHSAVAFPVQTPDAAAHQSAQHLLDRLCTGPGRRARCAYI